MVSRSITHPPTIHFVRSIFPGSVSRGAQSDETISGRNLQGTSEVFSTVPGLRISNINVAPDGTSVSFHVEADPTTPRTGDAATNLRVRALGRVSNPVAYLIQ